MNKKLFLIIVMALFLVVPVFAADNSATHTIATDAGAADYCTPFKLYGDVSLSVYGATWTGTVRIQRSMTGSAGTFADVVTYTSNVETRINEPANNIWYRVGQSNGDYGTGSVTIIVRKN